MELEITIKVPLGATGVSVQQQTAGMEALPAPVEAWEAPPPMRDVEAITRGYGGAVGTIEPDGEARAAVVVHEPPSPAEFGLPTALSAADEGPPSLEMIEQIAAPAATTNGPPGLEDLPVDLLAEHPDAPIEPPDLPDLSQVPSFSEDIAPPPVEDAEPTASPDTSPRQPAERTSNKARDQKE